jgi:adenosylhomocysteine nucleosidase
MGPDANAPVAVLAALKQEAVALTRLLPADGELWRGVLEDVPVAVALTGVGKVAAAMTAQRLCDLFHPRCFVSMGLAGGIGRDDERGRVVVASAAVQHDFDARPLTREPGVVPGIDSTELAADRRLTELLHESALETLGGRQVAGGVVLTGDQIITSSNARDRVLTQFPRGACFDMETAAIAQVARRNEVPWCGLRIVSDAADESFELNEVLEFGTTTAAGDFEKVIRALLKKL